MDSFDIIVLFSYNSKTSYSFELQHYFQQTAQTQVIIHSLTHNTKGTIRTTFMWEVNDNINLYCFEKVKISEFTWVFMISRC